MLYTLHVCAGSDQVKHEGESNNEEENLKKLERHPGITPPHPSLPSEVKIDIGEETGNNSINRTMFMNHLCTMYYHFTFNKNAHLLKLLADKNDRECHVITVCAFRTVNLFGSCQKWHSYVRYFNCRNILC